MVKGSHYIMAEKKISEYFRLPGESIAHPFNHCHNSRKEYICVSCKKPIIRGSEYLSNISRGKVHITCVEEPQYTLRYVCNADRKTQLKCHDRGNWDCKSCSHHKIREYIITHRCFVKKIEENNE